MLDRALTLEGERAPTIKSAICLACVNLLQNADLAEVMAFQKDVGAPTSLIGVRRVSENYKEYGYLYH